MMTARSRRELNKLREVVHFLLHCDLRHNVDHGTKRLPTLAQVCGDRGVEEVSPEEWSELVHAHEKQESTRRIVCYFCRKPLGAASDFNSHGNAIGPKFAEKLSVHHVDGNHENNADGNKALCHRSCHKGHHRREANAQRELRKILHASESLLDVEAAVACNRCHGNGCVHCQGD